MVQHELIIHLPKGTLKEVEKYKKSQRKQNIEEAVIELIQYALTLPSDFKDFDWEKAEAEADEEIRAGKTKSFDTVEDFLADLKQ